MILVLVHFVLGGTWLCKVESHGILHLLDVWRCAFLKVEM